MRGTELLLMKRGKRDLNLIHGLEGRWDSIKLLRLVQFACLAFREPDEIFKSPFVYQILALRLVCWAYGHVQYCVKNKITRIIVEHKEFANQLFMNVPNQMKQPIEA